MWRQPPRLSAELSAAPLVWSGALLPAAFDFDFDLASDTRPASPHFVFFPTGEGHDFSRAAGRPGNNPASAAEGHSAASSATPASAPPKWPGTFKGYKTVTSIFPKAERQTEVRMEKFHNLDRSSRST